MKGTRFTLLKRILPLIGIIIFIYLFFTLNLEKTTQAFLTIPPLYIILALTLTLPVIFLRTYIWQLINHQQHIHLGFFQTMKIFLIGYFYGTISPGYMGQLIRIPYMKEKTRQPYGKLFVNTFLETTLHTLSLYLMMSIGGLLILTLHPELFQIILIWIIIISVLFFIFINKNRGEKILYFLIRFLVPKQGKYVCTQFVNTFYTDFPRVRTLLVPFLLGAITWIIMFTQEYIIVLALGVSIPYLAFLVLFPIANTAGFLPVTLGGLGTREWTSILIFSSLYAVSREEVFVFTLVGFLITDVFTGFCGFLLSLTETKQSVIPSAEIKK